MNNEPPRDPFSAGIEEEGPAAAGGPDGADSGQETRPSVPRPEPRGIPYARAHAPGSVPSKRRGTIPGAASAPPSPLAPDEQPYQEPIPGPAPLPRLPEVDHFVGVEGDGAPSQDPGGRSLPDQDIERRRRSRRTVKVADDLAPLTTPSPAAPVVEHGFPPVPGVRDELPTVISSPPPEVHDDDWVSPEPSAAAPDQRDVSEAERITPEAPPPEPVSNPLARSSVPRPVLKPVSVPRPSTPRPAPTPEAAPVGYVADPDSVSVIRPLQIMSDLPPVSGIERAIESATESAIESATEPEVLSSASYPDEYEVAALPLRFLSDGPTPLDPHAELQADYQEVEPESAPEDEETEAEDDEGEGPPTAPDWRAQQVMDGEPREQAWAHGEWPSPVVSSGQIQARPSIEEIEPEPDEVEPEPRSDMEPLEELEPDRDSDVGEEIPVDMIDELEAQPKKPPPPPPRRPAPASHELPAYTSPIPPAATPVPTSSSPAPPIVEPLRQTPPPSAVRAPSEPVGPVSEAMSRRKKAWWEEIFGDDFSRTLDKIEPRVVRHEVDFIEERLGLEKSAVILDLACGNGSHAVELASRGYSVVGYDLSLSMLARAADEAQERAQKLNFLQGDMREMAFEETFDAVYCWSTSFGYFDEEKNADVLHRIHRGLRTGGLLLLDVINRDYVACRQPSLVWFEGDGCVCMDEMQIDFFTSRLKVKRTVMFEDGRSRELDYSIRLYGLHELGKLLHEAGFKVTEVTGHPAHPGVFFGSESPRIIVLAERS